MLNKNLILSKLNVPFSYDEWFKKSLLLRDAGFSIEEIKAWSKKGQHDKSDKWFSALYDYQGKGKLTAEQAIKKLAKICGIKEDEVKQQIPVFDDLENQLKCNKLFRIIAIDGKILVNKAWKQQDADKVKTYPTTQLDLIDVANVNYSELMKDCYYLRLNGIKDLTAYNKINAEHKAKGEKLSGYSIDDVKSFNWAMVESDDLPIQEQYNRFMQLNIPLVALIHSGNKSLHGIIHIGANNYEEWQKRVEAIRDCINKAGIPLDPSYGVERACRFPHCIRETKPNQYGNQYIVYLDEDYLTFTEWYNNYLESVKINEIFTYTPTKHKKVLDNMIKSYEAMKDTEEKALLQEQINQFKKENEIWKIDVSYVGIMNFLSFAGFVKNTNVDGTKDFYLLHGKTFRKVAPEFIADFLTNAIQTRIKNNKLVERFMHLKNLSKLIEENLSIKSFKKHSDSKNKTYFYFVNTMIETTANSIEEIKAVDGYIDSEDLIKSNFTYATEKGIYEKFIENIAGNDRKDAFMAGLGFLINRYKAEETNRLLVFTDGNMEQDGGTGKSLMLKGLNFIRHCSTIDGKGIDAGNSRFMFESVAKDATIVHIQDIEKFALTRIFNAITGDFAIERKGQQRIEIPFAESPKFCLSCNILPKQDNNSINRRVINYELTDYYLKNDIRTELGTLFGNNWTNEEWNKFYSFCIRCSQMYHKTGLIEPKQIQLQEKLDEANYGDAKEVFEAIDNGAFDDVCFYYNEYNSSGKQVKMPYYASMGDILKAAFTILNYTGKTTKNNFARKFNKYFGNKMINKTLHGIKRYRPARLED
ncbi:MAG: hypothetical protein IKP65_03515 [Alphaproteobacteria bacterium]|nr:hypothetical protein [Alphaproteobacteria bacterium]